MNRPTVDRVIGDVIRALGSAAGVTPLAVTLLVRQYAETGREDIAGALGSALAQAIALAENAGDLRSQAAWLKTFVEASRVADDDRVPKVCQTLATRLSARTDRTSISDAAVSLEARLAYHADQASVDELEHVIGRAYTPGGGLAGSELTDHVDAAAALLTAYTVTARIPYGMLAEEITQFTLRRLIPDGRRDGKSATGRSEHCLELCAFARVLVALAGLQRSAEYAEAAVSAQCDYGAEAAQLLASLDRGSVGQGFVDAAYALAVHEWLGLPQKK